MTEVPLADAHRRVTPGPERPGEGDLVVGDAAGGVREEHAVQPAADRQPAGQERRPAGRADRHPVILGELQSLGGHPVEVRRADRRVSVAAEVAVAQVVGE